MLAWLPICPRKGVPLPRHIKLSVVVDTVTRLEDNMLVCNVKGSEGLLA